jgi:intein-encoded DNA endonuclease-like protein
MDDEEPHSQLSFLIVLCSTKSVALIVDFLIVGRRDIEEIPRSIKRELINKFFDFNDKACISN